MLPLQNKEILTINLLPMAINAEENAMKVV